MSQIIGTRCLFCNKYFLYTKDGAGPDMKYCSSSCGIAYRYDRNKKNPEWVAYVRGLRYKTRRQKGQMEVGKPITITCRDHGELHTYTYKGGKRRVRCQQNKS